MDVLAAIPGVILQRHSKLLLFVIFLSAVNPALAQRQQQCIELDRIANQTEELTSAKILDTVKRAYTSLWGGESIPESDQLYFTNASGFSIRPKCEERVTYGPHLYYPMGLVVKKLSNITFVGTRNTYTLVEGEHGMRMYINSAHLQELEDGKTYFFADSLTFPTVCLGTQACAGEQKSKHLAAGQQLHPTSQYAVADSLVVGCSASTHVTLYRVGHEQLLRGDGQVQRATIDTCDNDMQWSPDIKRVVADEYQHYYDYPIGGHYQRFSNSLLSKLIPNQTNIKDCNESQSSSLTTSASAGAQLSSNYLVNLNIGGSGELSNSTETTLQQGIYIFYSSYFMDNNPSGVVETIFTCDDTPNLLPQDLYLVTIFNRNLDGDRVSISARQLFSQDTLFAPEVPEPFAGIGYASLSGKRIGQYFRIQGYYEFFRLKEIFRNFLENETGVPNLVTPDADQYEYDRNLEFFTQLLLAAMVEPRPRR